MQQPFPGCPGCYAVINQTALQTVSCGQAANISLNLNCPSHAQLAKSSLVQLQVTGGEGGLRAGTWPGPEVGSMTESCTISEGWLFSLSQIEYLKHHCFNFFVVSTFETPPKAMCSI